MFIPLPTQQVSFFHPGQPYYQFSNFYWNAASNVEGKPLEGDPQYPLTVKIPRQLDFCGRPKASENEPEYLFDGAEFTFAASENLFQALKTTHQPDQATVEEFTNLQPDRASEKAFMDS